jgi:hypothetical protein
LKVSEQPAARSHTDKKAKSWNLVDMTPNVRDQRRRAVGAPLAEQNLGKLLAVLASGVTTRDDRCIA